MSTATNGRAREHRISKLMIKHGWLQIMRAAGSKGPADLAMLHPLLGLAWVQVGTAKSKTLSRHHGEGARPVAEGCGMNLPPGLTCCGCQRALYPSLACMTSDGWHHIDCAAFDTCGTCQQPMVAASRWSKLTASQRGTAVADGYRRKDGPGICARCAHSMRKGQRAAARRAEDDRQRAERLEDVRWMVEHGEHLHGAAARLGIGSNSLDTFLRRAGEIELLDRLIRRNPTDHNSPTSAARDALMSKRVAA